MIDPRHLMILASAGAGKTYALTTRFVRLLAAGAEPERIVALTFTRKAAGEFFDEILNRLANAVGDTERAAKLGEEVGRPELGPGDFLQLLRRIIEAMPRLRLGTLDGFFAQMVQAFPLELGLSGEFVLLDEATARRERQRVLGLIFAAGATSETARDDFIEAFKRATYGVEEKGLQRRLNQFLDEHGETYWEAPAETAWGDVTRIWPQGNDWLTEAEPLALVAARCAASLPWEGLNEKQRVRLEAFLTGLAEWEPGATLPKPVEYVVKNTLAGWDALGAGAGAVTIERKKVAFDPAPGRDLAAVVRAIVAAELMRKLEITRGIHAVLSLYDHIYDEQVRRAGKLTFADVQRVLQPEGSGGFTEECRLLIDWRLDARFDHWLLDEFQDTSREQWAILSNLIDEAVQDPEGRRSFFYVGDVKQAIYGWRGGDARLFREIYDYYNVAGKEGIKEAFLADSWRSGSAVIEMVNAVCGGEEALAAMLPSAVVERWMQDWREHKSARLELDGWAELREAEGEDGRFAETLRILGEIDAAERGLTVAVLVQKNATGARLAEYLRAEGGMAAIAESDLQIAFDNPMTCAILALLQVAAHPGDTMAKETVEMTPVAEVMAELGWAASERVCVEVLGEVNESGFGGMVAVWLKRLEPKLALDDAFSRLRGRQLLDAARGYDESGGRDVAEFLDWAEAHTLRETESPGVIRVMTVHKAKGLGFDVVVLPDLQGQSVDQRRRGLAVHRDGTHKVDWVLDLPSQQLADNDAVLSAQIAAEKAESAYEAMCRLYVALTRAKRALYVVIEPVGRSSLRNFPKLLTRALGSAWSRGNCTWYQELGRRERAAAEELEVSPGLATVEASDRKVRRMARTPSSEADVTLRGTVWFTGGSDDQAAWGTAVHELLATVEWVDGVDLGTWRRDCLVEGKNEQVVATVVGLLEADSVQSVFTQPTADSWVWRECAFEVVRAGAWITGVFDRVVIERNTEGRALKATVYDFKTDRVSPEEYTEEAKRYAAQLALYGGVVAQLTGLPMQNVETNLVWVGSRVVTHGLLF
ncbi:MAG: UvrD-helicase domain-containing protein [Candidatus Synoicihabitans palmerolidicus]|nr:UvrD-helicase domain-containing protein [Candidatus Synoicihabitans palmerolidicus]